MAVREVPIAFSVYGKSAIITGAGSGIGYEFAKLLLLNNCNVLIADLALRKEAQGLLDRFTGRGNTARAVFVGTDVTIWHELTRMFDEAEREFGGFDIVCPGAGVFEPRWSSFWRPPGTATSKDSIEGTVDGLGHYGTLDLNLTHPIRATQMAISRWLNATGKTRVSPANPKRVAHISSISGQISSFPFPLYTASKHAINGFVRCMEGLEGFGIRVNGVAPGIINTPLWSQHPEKKRLIDKEEDDMDEDIWIEPAEVAEQLLRCCEDDSIGPGVIWEVLKDSYRVVSSLNDPGAEVRHVLEKHSEAMSRETMYALMRPGWGLPQNSTK